MEGKQEKMERRTRLQGRPEKERDGNGKIQAQEQSEGRKEGNTQIKEKEKQIMAAAVKL